MNGVTELDCDCCEPPAPPPPPEECVYFTDTFTESTLSATDWTVLSGSWTVGGGKLIPNSDGSSLRCNASELSPRTGAKGAAFSFLGFNFTGTPSGTAIFDIGWEGVDFFFRYTIVLDGEGGAGYKVTLNNSSGVLCDNNVGGGGIFGVTLLGYSSSMSGWVFDGLFYNWPLVVPATAKVVITATQWVDGLYIAGPVNAYQVGNPDLDCDDMPGNCFYPCVSADVVIAGVTSGGSCLGLCFNGTYNGIDNSTPGAFGNCSYRKIFEGCSDDDTIVSIFAVPFGNLQDGTAQTSVFAQVESLGAGAMMQWGELVSGWITGPQSLSLASGFNSSACNNTSSTCNLFLTPPY